MAEFIWKTKEECESPFKLAHLLQKSSVLFLYGSLFSRCFLIPAVESSMQAEREPLF
jgi:hypothetical protein